MIDISNLIKYKMVHSPAGYSDFIRICDKGECGEYVKFEDVVELLKHADNSQSMPCGHVMSMAHWNDGQRHCYKCGQVY